MFEKDDKKRLYWLIDQYMLNKITEREFCDEFYYCYDLELDYKILTKLERKVFSELGTVSGRFTEYQEDLQLDTKAFFTTEQLRKKITESKEKLQSQTSRSKD